MQLQLRREQTRALALDTRPEGLDAGPQLPVVQLLQALRPAL